MDDDDGTCNATGNVWKVEERQTAEKAASCRGDAVSIKKRKSIREGPAFFMYNVHTSVKTLPRESRDRSTRDIDFVNTYEDTKKVL